jgi:hypothetical protein
MNRSPRRLSMWAEHEANHEDLWEYYLMLPFSSLGAVHTIPPPLFSLWPIPPQLPSVSHSKCSNQVISCNQLGGGVYRNDKEQYLMIFSLPITVWGPNPDSPFWLQDRVSIEVPHSCISLRYTFGYPSSLYPVSSILGKCSLWTLRKNQRIEE